MREVYLQGLDYSNYDCCDYYYSFDTVTDKDFNFLP